MNDVIVPLRGMTNAILAATASCEDRSILLPDSVIVLADAPSPITAPEATVVLNADANTTGKPEA